MQTIVDTFDKLNDFANGTLTLNKISDSDLSNVLVSLEKQIPKKPICKEMPYSEEVGFNDEWYCPTCNSYIGYFTEGMSEPEQMEYCNECGQHIARDWSE